MANPHNSIYLKLGLDNETAGAIGILTITPYEGVIIAADVATKAADTEVGFLDRFGGSLLLVGDIASVETAVSEVVSYFSSVLNYSTAEVTRS